MRAIGLLFIACFLAACAASPPPRAVDRLVAFGDSNADSGNAFRMNPRGSAGPPNWRGHHSNGPLATEYLAEMLGARLENHAVAGATTAETIAQVKDFAEGGGRFSPEDAVLLWTGSNDLAGSSREDRYDLAKRIATAAANIQATIARLRELGARRIVVGNRTARLRRDDDDLNGVDLNAAIAQAVERSDPTGAHVVLFDAYGSVREMMAHPERYGFTHPAEECLADPRCVSERFEDGQPVAKGYVHWDGAHKTTRAHHVMAEQMAPLLGARRALVPIADHHQHLFGPGIARLLSTREKPFPGIDAPTLVRLLDEAGMRRAVVLSVAYLYGSPSRNFRNEIERVREENDWTAAQAARYPDRLVAFCGINPLRDYALAEIERCASDPRFGKGLKLHFGNSDVQLEDPAHVEQLRKVFALANARGMALVIHLRASISKQRPYGAAQARTFIEQLLPMAPDVTVQVAHLAGTGPGFEDPAAHEVLGVLAEAVERRDPRARNLYFDVASIAHPSNRRETNELIARRIRQVGTERILYGTDAAVGDGLAPRQSWAAFRDLPLTRDEIDRIAHNVAPYLRPIPP